MAREQDAQDKDRRQHERLAHPFEGRWDGASGSGLCRIGDLSAGGCFVQTLAQPALGERTSVTIGIGDRTFTLAGRVVANHPGQGFSMQFDAGADGELAEFKRLIGGLIAQRPTPDRV